MATVYLARDIRHGRRVAIKVLKPELAADDGSTLSGSRTRRDLRPMRQPLLLSAVTASVFGLGHSEQQQPSRVNLAGVATVQLASSFNAVPRGRTGARSARDFDPASLEFHRNERQATFRFGQDQRRDITGAFRDPVLLDITLFNRALPAPNAATITNTTIGRFYPPIDSDSPRLAAHFTAQRWLPNVTHGTAVTHSAATNEGRGDNLVSGPPERWLVIHVDPVRRVRVDLYAWRKNYSLDEARALVRRVAESVEVTPKLRELFESVKTVDDRVTAKHARAVSDAVGRLRACGITSLEPGYMAWSGACAAWLSNDRRYLHVARAMGKVPLAAATREPRQPPAFRVRELPGRSPALIGPPDFQLLMLYWDADASRWSLEEPGRRLYDDEPKESPLVAAIAERLTERANAYLVGLARYDLQFHAERVAVDAFLFEADRVAAALRAGTLIPGVNAAPDAFGR